jgi:hypothetical protein
MLKENPQYSEYRTTVSSGKTELIKPKSMYIPRFDVCTIYEVAFSSMRQLRVKTAKIYDIDEGIG